MDLRAEHWEHVPVATWYNWVAQAKSAKPTAADLAVARDALRRSLADPAALSQTIAPATMPASESADGLTPGEARRSLNLIGRLEELWQDCLMVRRHAIKHNDAGGEDIKLLKAFCQSVNMRNGIIGNVLAALDKLWNMQKMQDFHDAVIDEVRRESPECAARIVARMARLSAATGVQDDGARV
ncbi:hypothetical protein [Zoogloea oryzae]|nr:hypothetical protein [Zoogloea oryzae]